MDEFFLFLRNLSGWILLHTLPDIPPLTTIITNGKTIDHYLFVTIVEKLFKV